MTTTTKTADATTAPTAGEAVLDARGVTMRFGGLTAVRDVNLTVNSGEIVGLIGPNGAGKTTFFNCLTGLYVPTEGEVRYKGTVLPPTSYKVTDAGIARTFQNIRLFHNMTVLENVLVGRHTRMKQGLWSALLRLPGFKKAEAEATKRAMELLEFIGLQDKAQHLAKNLPYGEQRKLEIARALASDPGLILLDEPTAGMNPQETRAAEELIFAIRDMGIAVLVIEHDMRFIFNLCDRVAVLVQGQKLIEGDSQTVQSDERVIAAYLGEPVAEDAPAVETPAKDAPVEAAPAKDAPAKEAPSSEEDEASEAEDEAEDDASEDSPSDDAPETPEASADEAPADEESSEDTPQDPASGKENDA
ncbi:ABC transporter ATP-binding protein [Streptomyces sp. WAC01280]|uniref:ABC transporter ATP-binding protein n=1 Tax=Streptomyces sp. WAC01280 TaxID=2487424 RepID=UPI000F789E21|nr:ABC transporter ATP-binding protein [Streptomyces sp. WAC01280]RSS51971.1 ABC transporter ATP-binding protein [Streptomyces sp. WAC01280]